MTPPRRMRMFGTDGVRGAFGVPPLDETTVRALGVALGETLSAQAQGAPPRAVLGGDTRASTPTLCAWLADGLRAHGVDIVYLGMVTTPCVAWVTRDRNANAGIAVSASHNPWRDNGIKLIGGGGFKWTSEAESALETTVARHAAAPPNVRATAPLVAEAEPVTAYLASLGSALPSGQPLAGLHLALDAANGAASPFARPLFESLGAKVEVTHAAPDGHNINRDCGSTHPEAVAALSHSTGADLGIAFDGDADRALFVDERGNVRDGDAVLYLWARALHRNGELPHDKIVATSMSNLGLEVALDRHDIGLVRCDVGDRAVVETMKQHGLTLGGEQSGHIVHLGLATTGDGLLTALHVAHQLARADRPFSELLNGFQRFPQLIRNVPVRVKPDLSTISAIQTAAARTSKTLGDHGRLVLRYSGTEPLARIMIEGRDVEQIEDLAARLAAVIEAEIGHTGEPSED